ncbi:MAG: hypothetical protein QM683_10215 [Lacrimispora sp.]
MTLIIWCDSPFFMVSESLSFTIKTLRGTALRQQQAGDFLVYQGSCL